MNASEKACRLIDLVGKHQKENISTIELERDLKESLYTLDQGGFFDYVISFDEAVFIYELIEYLKNNRLSEEVKL